MSAPARPGFVSTFAILALTRGSLRFLGFRRTVRFAKWLGERTPAGDGVGTPEDAARAIATAAAFFPGRAICLEQSVALYVILRRRRHPAALRIGVQPYPFQAHAWIELAGAPLFENADVVSKYIPFPQAFA